MTITCDSTTITCDSTTVSCDSDAPRSSALNTLPVFPSSLLGLSYNRGKMPIWSTSIHQAASGKESATSYWSYPRWQWDLPYEFLRDDSTNELQTLMGFFNKCLGAGGRFIYSDASDNTVTTQPLGVGDGTTTKFQLLRTMGGFVEPISSCNGIPTVYLNGVVATGGYAVDQGAGVIAFDAAPGAGVAITATFSFSFRCRFLSDILDFNNFMLKLWELKKLQFVSVK